jgi:hypothetical protein
MKCPKLAQKILATVLLAGVSATASAQMMIPRSGLIINPLDRVAAKNRSSRKQSILAHRTAR